MELLKRMDGRKGKKDKKMKSIQVSSRPSYKDEGKGCEERKYPKILFI
jgi:hypothetical protein